MSTGESFAFAIPLGSKGWFQRRLQTADRLPSLAPRRKRSRNVEQRYACPKCPSYFAWDYSLRRHLKNECGREPRYCCPYCPYRGKWKSNVARHVRKVHKNYEVYVLCGVTVAASSG